MKTVKEVSRLTGVSVRTLHHYDAIGLLKPTQITHCGYRLYDQDALERMYQILMYRELGLSLKEIDRIIHASDSQRQKMLSKQINAMQSKVNILQNRIDLAKTLQITGGNNMDFESFDPQKIDDYEQQAKVLYGKTDAYQQYTQKSKNRTKTQELDLGAQLMDHFTKLGAMMPCEANCDMALAWAKELRAFISTHYYDCTPQILGYLAQSYGGGGSMNENIDKAGGEGTGAFAQKVIEAYLAEL